MWKRGKEARKKLTGSEAEQLARRHLKSQGLEILTSNYRCRRGEIDIICRDINSLVFVEVRCRSRTDFGSAAESVTYRKQQRLIYAAEHYLQKYPTMAQMSCRFDVICIEVDTSLPHKIPAYRVEWLTNAFSA